MSEVFRAILTGPSHMRASFKDILMAKLRKVLLSMDTLDLEELDLWLGVMPGCDYHGIRAGQQAITQPP